MTAKLNYFFPFVSPRAESDRRRCRRRHRRFSPPGDDEDNLQGTRKCISERNVAR
jgi:hypothetical protein